MRPALIFIIPVVLFSTVVVCQSAGDPQRQLAEERRRMIRPPEAATQTQRVQQPVQVQQYSNAQRERDRNQLLRTSDRSSLTQGGTSPLQVVNIDRLKVQSDAPGQYQFEALQTLNIQESDPSRAEVAVNTETTEAAEAELQGETPADEVAVSETPVEEQEEDSPVEEMVFQAGAGQTIFRIIEDENRIVVTQVDAPTKTGTLAP
jgi:hypothetical protein